MSSNTFERKTIENGKLQFQIQYQYDDMPFEEGKYSNTAREFSLDRKENVFLGEWVENSKHFDSYDAAMEWLDGFSHFEESEFIYDLDESDEELESGELYFCGYETFETDFSTSYDGWNSYRYWYPDIENYKGIEKSELVKYCLQDCKRNEDYNRNEWFYQGIVVTLFIDDQEISENSLWGIESDSGKEYFEEVEKELMQECLSEAKDQVKLFEEIVNILKELED